MPRGNLTFHPRSYGSSGRILVYGVCCGESASFEGPLGLPPCGKVPTTSFPYQERSFAIGKGATQLRVCGALLVLPVLPCPFTECLSVLNRLHGQGSASPHNNHSLRQRGFHPVCLHPPDRPKTPITRGPNSGPISRLRLLSSRPLIPNQCSVSVPGNHRGRFEHCTTSSSATTLVSYPPCLGRPSSLSNRPP